MEEIKINVFSWAWSDMPSQDQIRPQIAVGFRVPVLLKHVENSLECKITNFKPSVMN